MPTKEQYQDHKWCLEHLKKAQDADHDMREQARECATFLTSRRGMWEQQWWEASDGKPRYTFDLTTPIVDQIEGAMARVDFDIHVHPAGGPASKEVAETLDGLVRHIEDLSSADQVYRRAGRNTAIKGLSGWEVVQAYADGNSFDQDLMIKPIPNWLDSVWLGPHTEPDGSDAKYGWKLAGLTREEHKKKYPNASDDGSVEGDRSGNTFYHRHDLIMVGAFYYLQPERREITLMSNGKVYDADQLEQVRDELEMLEITEVDSRMTTVHKLYIRKFDANGWLSEPQETVFEEWLTLVPCYANYDYNEDKNVWYGAIEKLIDPQRVYNYSKSREIEEGALAPRAKWVVTDEQIGDFQAEWENMNTSTAPYLRYNHVNGQPPPTQQGGASINPGLQALSADMKDLMQTTAGLFSANHGRDAGFEQSGVAIEALQERGDQGNSKFITAREVSQRHTGRILVKAIPKVYLPNRQVRILQEDGTFDTAIIGEQIIDQQTGDIITLNDLQQGTYDVTCKSGPSFNSRQSRTVSTITELGQYDPTLISDGSDIVLRNVNAPGVDQLADRKRRELFLAGKIPVDQMDDKEQQEYQLMQQQPPQESPEMVLAKGEAAKGEADLVEAQTKQMELQWKVEQGRSEIEVRRFEAETKRIEAAVKAEEVGANIQGIVARAAKDLSEAEAQDIENAATESGIMQLVEEMGAIGG